MSSKIRFFVPSPKTDKTGRPIAMDCVHGDGNGLFRLDEESFNRVMEVVVE